MLKQTMTVLGLAVLALSGCVDSPDAFAAKAEADGGDPLALTFDELARQAKEAGDVTRAEGFTYAAVAVRTGVTPSRLDVRNAGTLESYEAFVQSVSWGLTGTATPRVPAHRTLTAWRRTTDGFTRILSITTPSDSAPVTHPLSLNPNGPIAAMFAGASGLFHETASLNVNTTTMSNAIRVPDRFWIASSGWVRVRESVTGAACQRGPGSAQLPGVSCQQAKFAVRLDMGMLPLTTRPLGLQSNGDVRRFVTQEADQVVNGYKLTFTCVTVSSSRGCA